LFLIGGESFFFFFFLKNGKEAEGSTWLTKQSDRIKQLCNPTYFCWLYIMRPSVRSTFLDSSTFVLGVNLGNDIDYQQTLPTRFHFVLDNSGSMGSLTSTARDCFAQLVNTSTAPCSLVVFADGAIEIGRNFVSADAMCKANLPQQGQTNITAGVGMALDIIVDIELAQGSGQTHHVMVLLSDGAHNKGERPEAAAPRFGQEIRHAR
jgi:hypothetical protein